MAAYNPRMKNLVCLISGRGSNLEAVLRAQQAQGWTRRLGGRVAAVISNRGDARGLEIARAFGVPAEVLSHRDFPSREAFDASLRERIEAFDPALVVLAGFLRILTPGFVDHFRGRLLNIHPSLLPSFPGLDTHLRALQAGVRVHGTTVHFVTGELDAGPIVAQAALAVDPADTVASLAARVLALEHVLLPRCIEWILEGRVRLGAQGVECGDLGRADLLLGPS